MKKKHDRRSASAIQDVIFKRNDTDGAVNRYSNFVLIKFIVLKVQVFLNKLYLTHFSSGYRLAARGQVWPVKPAFDWIQKLRRNSWWLTVVHVAKRLKLPSVLYKKRTTLLN